MGKMSTSHPGLVWRSQGVEIGVLHHFNKPYLGTGVPPWHSWQPPPTLRMGLGVHREGALQLWLSLSGLLDG